MLLEYALAKGGASCQDKVSEILFRKYFTDGVFLDEDALVAVAEEAGIPATASEVQEALRSQAGNDTASQKAAQASRDGITGVPFFFFNGKPAFSGAQEPAAFVQAINQAQK